MKHQKAGSRKLKFALEGLESRVTPTSFSPPAAWASALRDGARVAQVSDRPAASGRPFGPRAVLNQRGRLDLFAANRTAREGGPLAALTQYQLSGDAGPPATSEPFGSGSYIDLRGRLDFTVPRPPSGSQPMVVFTRYELPSDSGPPASDEPFGSRGSIDLSNRLDLSVSHPSSGGTPNFVVTEIHQIADGPE